MQDFNLSHLFFPPLLPSGPAEQCYYQELERNKNENDYNIVRPNEN